MKKSAEDIKKQSMKNSPGCSLVLFVMTIELVQRCMIIRLYHISYKWVNNGKYISTGKGSGGYLPV